MIKVRVSILVTLQDNGVPVCAYLHLLAHSEGY